MKKTVISAAIVGVSLAGFRSDMDKAGDWYDNHQGPVDSALTTAATIAKTLAYENDNQYGFKKDLDKAGDFYDKHQTAIDDSAEVAAKIGKVLADQDDEFGVKQRAEFVAKHGRTIAKIASLFGDQNDNQFDFKSDMDKAGDFYDKHQTAIDDSAEVAAKIGKALADENDNQFGALAQKAWHFFRYGPELAFGFKSDVDKAGDWYKNHQGPVDGALSTTATIAKTFADEDDEFGIKQRAEFVAKHGGTIARIAGMFGDSNDNELDFKSDMDKAGDWYKNHQGPVDGALSTAATIAKTLAYENDDINDHLRHDSNLKSLRGLEAPRRRGFLGN